MEGAKKASNPGDRSDEVLARTNLGSGNRKNPIKLLANQENQKLVFAENAFEANCVLYIRNCTGCQYTVLTHAAKVMIEGCTDCTVTLHGKVITSTAEVWKCTNTTVVCNVKLALQLDLCPSLRLRYARSADLVQLVWAGMKELVVEFADEGQPTHETGLAKMLEFHKGDVNPEMDQFIVRIIDGKLLEERIVRLPNGFPTTDREADLFDAENAKKEKAMQEMARKLIRDNPGLVSGQSKTQQKTQMVRDPKKVKPNDPCHCGSGKKYKKCHRDADEKEAQDKKTAGPERKARLEDGATK